MFTKPQAEHEWLQQLVGEWTTAGECFAGPDQPPQKFTGRQKSRMVGGLWLICEGEGDSPDGGTSEMIITLGYDPDQSKFVGTFISGMGGFLWHYSGSLDAARKTLTLDAKGPKFDSPGMANYQDIIKIVSPDHYEFSSRIQGDDGQWTQFMTSDYRRKK